jgi:hypothetical protein
MSQTINPVDIPREEGVGTGTFLIPPTTFDIFLPFSYYAQPMIVTLVTLPQMKLSHHKEDKNSQTGPVLCSPCILRGQRITIRR